MPIRITRRATPLSPQTRAADSCPSTEKRAYRPRVIGRQVLSVLRSYMDGSARLKMTRCHRVIDGERRRGRGGVRVPDRRIRGESRRQEDRRGTLAVERGPLMRGSGGVADRLGPLPVNAGGQARGQAPGVLYAGSAPCGEAFRLARPVCLPSAGSWAPPDVQGLPLPGTPPADSLPQPGRFLESTETVLSLAGTGGGDLIRHHH